MNQYIVFDIGGSHIKYGLLTESGEVLENYKVRTPESLEELIQILDKRVKKHLPEVSGVAVSSPGRIDIEAGTIYVGGALPYLDGLNVKKHFKEKFNLPAAVVNDGKGAAQAELWKGNLQGVDYAASIALGTGIGGAVIIDGKVLQGENFLAGEFSSVFLNERAPNKSLTEANSAVYFVKRMAEILELKDEHDGKAVFEVINSGENKEINQEFSQYCRRLVHFISNLQVMLNITHVVIGGGISEQPILIEELNNQYRILRDENPDIKAIFSEPLVIDKCKYSNNSNLIGALYQLLLDQGKIEKEVTQEILT